MKSLTHEKCLLFRSNFRFIFTFVETFHDSFGHLCSVCPIEMCYAKFMQFFSVFQMVSRKLCFVLFSRFENSLQMNCVNSVFKLFQVPQNATRWTIPFLNIPVTSHDVELMLNTFYITNFVLVLQKTFKFEVS